jgi:TRAP-type C4-dicarboxylate transport system permease small subunit
MDGRTPVDRAAIAIGVAAAWLFVAAAAVTVYEVAMRYLLASPTTWAHEVTTTLCAVGFCLGGAYAMARREHIRISVLIDRLGPRGRRAADLLALAVGVVYLAGLGYAATLIAAESVWRFDSRGWSPEPTPGPPHLPLPAIVKTALAAGTVLFLLVVLAHLARLALGRGDGSPKR